MNLHSPEALSSSVTPVIKELRLSEGVPTPEFWFLSRHQEEIEGDGIQKVTPEFVIEGHNLGKQELDRFL